MNLKIKLFLTFLFYSLNIFSQNKDWTYLSKSLMVTDFAEDGNYIWICNYSDVTRLNKITGKKTFYNECTSPIPGSVNNMIVDRKGIKWFATSVGIARYDGINWSFFNTKNSPLPAEGAHHLIVDRDNNLWVAASGLFKFDGINWTVYNTSNSGLPDYHISCLYAEGNTIWASTYKGLSKFDGIDWTNYDTSNSNISEQRASRIEMDSKGNMWLAYSSEIAKFDGKSFSFFNIKNTNLPNIMMTSMTIDENDIIWAGCGTYYGSKCNPCVGGVMSFDGSVWEKYDIYNSKISDDQVNAVFVDNSNNLWIGGFYGGMVDKKKGSEWTSYDPSGALIADRSVRQIVFDTEGAAYIGTGDPGFYSHDGGLVKYNWKTWEQIDNYFDDSWAIGTDKNNSLYIKSRNDIKKFDDGGWSKLPDSPFLGGVNVEFEEMAFDNSGGIWIDYLSHVSTDDFNNNIFNEGIANYDGKQWTLFNSKNSIIQGEINDIQIDRNNTVWLATNFGIAMYKDEKWTLYDTSNSEIPLNYIESLTIDSNLNLWIPDGNYGLVKFDGTSWVNFPHPTMSKYLAWGIDLKAEPEGKIWQIAGANNFIGFDGTGDWTTFDPNNSPIPEDCNTLSLSIDKYGNKWIGTSKGILIYKAGGVVKPPIAGLAEKGTVLIYPNPFKNGFEIILDSEYAHLELALYDAIGREIFSESYKFVESIKVSDQQIRSGIYFYRLKAGDKIIASGKLIAE